MTHIVFVNLFGDGVHQFTRVFETSHHDLSAVEPVGEPLQRLVELGHVAYVFLHLFLGIAKMC